MAPQMQWTAAGTEGNPAGPKVGAELLTELRLAELKRLIDRDAQALKKTSERQEPASGSAPQPVMPGAPRHLAPGRERTDADVSAEGGQEAVSSGAFAVGAPGLEVPVEQTHICVASWEPESRQYGEMGVRAGDEIFVVGEVQLNDWIWGAKRGDNPDEGWIPASALGLVNYTSDEDEEAPPAGRRQRTRQRPEPEPLREPLPPSARKGKGGKGGDATDEAVTPRGRKGGGLVEGKGQSQQLKGSAEKARRQARAEVAAAEERQQRQLEKRQEEEGWHQHGNWWSKQRHLKATEATSREARAPREAEASWKESESWGRGQSWKESDSWREPEASWAAPKPVKRRPQPPPEEFFDDVDYDGYHRPAGRGRGAAVGRGSGGRGGKGEEEAGAGSGRGRGPRERASLNSLMDRLAKPLVPPKPADH